MGAAKYLHYCVSVPQTKQGREALTSKVLFFPSTLDSLLKIAIDRKCHLSSDFFRAEITIFFSSKIRTQNYLHHLTSRLKNVRPCVSMNSTSLTKLWWFDLRFEPIFATALKNTALFKGG